MAFYCTKPSLIDPSITLYYVGGNRWSDNYTEKVNFAKREILENKIANLDGKSGPFRKAIVVEE